MCKVNVDGSEKNEDENAEIAQEYEIDKMPTFILIKGGKQVAKVDVPDVEKLKEAIN